MKFGETLTSLRKTKGWSQEQLAEKLEVTRQTISKWELEQSSPDAEYLIRLSETFEVSIDYLLKGEPSLKEDTSIGCNNEKREVIGYRRCFILGTLCTLASLGGLIAFGIASALNPWTTIINQHAYEGLLGFVLGTKTFPCFLALCVIFVSGCLLAAYGIVRELHPQKASSGSCTRKKLHLIAAIGFSFAALCFTVGLILSTSSIQKAALTFLLAFISSNAVAQIILFFKKS